MSRPLVTLSAATGLLAAGAAGGAALAPQPDPPAVHVAAAPPAPAEIRTVVIHRTKHVYRHPKHHRVRVVGAPPARPAVPVAPVPVVTPRVVVPAAPAAPLVTRTSQPTAATKPLVTRTSGAAGHERGDDRGEREGGGDD